MDRFRSDRSARFRGWAAPSALLFTAVVFNVATSGCSNPSENAIERAAHAGAPPAGPKVTVANPLSEAIREWHEYTGRAEAKDSVEIRARIGGHLQRAAFKEGSRVKKGDLLFVVDARPFAAVHARAQAELDGARAETAIARLDAARSEKLWSGQVISERERDLQRSQVAQREAATRRAEAVLQEAALDLEYSTLRAPIDGRIGRIQVTAGNLVGPSTPLPLTTLVSIDPLHVYVDVVEADAMNLAGAGRAAEVGFAGEEGYPHHAVIDFVDNHVEPSSGTVKVRAVIDNADGKLTPGLFARVRLAADQPKDSVLVVDAAFGTDQTHKFAYVIDASGKVEYRDVDLGGLHDGLRVVKRGLSSSDRVVIHGLQRVRPGASVEAEIAPMREATAAADTNGKTDGGAP